MQDENKWMNDQTMVSDNNLISDCAAKKTQNKLINA